MSGPLATAIKKAVYHAKKCGRQEVRENWEWANYHSDMEDAFLQAVWEILERRENDDEDEGGGSA